MYQSSSFTAESSCDDDVCEECCTSAIEWSVLSRFPALTDCRIVSSHPDAVHVVINHCKELTVF